MNENKKAEKVVPKLTVTDLNVDDGLEKLLEKLDSTFKTEKTQESHNVYKDFNKFQQWVTDNSSETESHLVTSNETVNESNKNTKTTHKTQSNNSEIDPTILNKGQILSFKINGNENKVEIFGTASKATCKYPDWSNVLYLYPNTEKGKSGSIGFYEVDDLKFVENTEESIMKISSVCYYDAK